MTFNEYQNAAMRTAIFTHPFYPAASLMIEAAELADLLAKPLLRGDAKGCQRSDIVSEAGDVLWNLAALLADQGITLAEVAERNIEKLADRAARGVLAGSGGDR